MHLLATIALSAAVLVLGSAVADPAQPQAPAGANVQAAPTLTGTQTAIAPSQMATPPAQPATAPAAGAPAQTAAASPSGSDLDQTVCKDMPAKIGSRIGGGSECHTQRVWNQMRQQSQDVTRHQQRMGYH